MKSLLFKLYVGAEKAGRNDIESALRKYTKGGVLLDIGCWDGINTKRWAKAMKADKLIGIEVIKDAAIKAKRKKIEVLIQDIDKDRWAVNTNSVDVVLSNLVVEHLSDIDHFVSESFRVLKSGGCCIVSTNNLSSWHNIFSLLLGFAPFDLVNSSKKRWAIGNPFSLHREEPLATPTFAHKCVYTTRWLKEWYEIYGFKFCAVYGAGYYPLPAFLGKLDKTHAALITLVFTK